MSGQLPEAVFGQLVGTTTGLLLLTAVLLAWRRGLAAAARLLALQGAALAVLIAVIGWQAGEPELFAVALLVLAGKAVILPRAIARSEALLGPARGDSADSSRLNPTAALGGVALLSTLAYLVAAPLAAVGSGPAARAAPVGLALVLTGFLVLVTGRRALSQVIGFLTLDNGISAVAFLTAEGTSLIVELGVLLDVLLVALILLVLTGRLRAAFGGTDLDDLRELRD